MLLGNMLPIYPSYVSLEHRCDKAGCGSVIVLDGNMKNHRGVCLATHAGFAVYDGLPGAIQTSCPNTPAHRSRFCSLAKTKSTFRNFDDNWKENNTAGC